jgi:hypothetical protein
MKEDSQMTIFQSSQKIKLNAEFSEKKVSDKNRKIENIDKNEIDIKIEDQLQN